MRLDDVLKMAIHNLWQRKLRTALNLTGIVVGCIVLLMTVAGVSGVKDALHALFDSAEAARQIGVYPNPYSGLEPPEKAIEVIGEMSEERRTRIRDRLTDLWKSQNRRPRDWRITPQQIAAMSALPHVRSVVPDISVECSARIHGKDQVVDTIGGIDVQSGLVADRLIVGEMLSDETRDEALIDEFTAYQLGYYSDSQLAEIVGQELVVEYQVSGGRVSNIYNLLTETWGQLSQSEYEKQAQFVTTLSQLIGDLDSTSLSEDQKKMIRDLIHRDEAVDSATPVSVSKKYRIRGVLRGGEPDSLSRLFRGHYLGRSGGIFLHHEVASGIHLAAQPESSFYNAIVTVDSTRHLAAVTEALEEQGQSAMSALRIIENIDRNIDESAWIVLGIAAAILLTAAIGISNTLLISVLERTPEFGILKSVGAKDTTLVLLMVCEGAILGLLGAIIAITVSLVLATIGDGILKSYVENRIDHNDLASTLFQFSLGPMLAVIGIAIAICVLASILPAWRAARLDPVVAMRRT